MAGAVGKYAANKLLKKQMAKYQGKKVGGDTDPYFAEITDPRTGKKKKVKKQIPSYIPEHDAMILAKMRSRAYKLDMGLFNFAGTRFGWSSVIGIVPGFGDAADVALAIMLALKCSRVKCKLDTTTMILMALNILVDFVIGFVPFLGDICDAYFKANTRNVRLLEKRLDAVYKPKDVAEQQERMFKENRYARDEHQPATEFEDFSDEDDERRAFVREQDGQDRTRRSEPAASKTDRNGGRGGGWFSGGRRKENDVEMAQAPPRMPPRPREYDQETGTLVNERR